MLQVAKGDSLGSELAKQVLVINQFAVPEGNPGGTRHVEMFSLLTNWRPTFIIGSSNYFSGGAIFTSDERFRVINIRSKGKSPLRRAISWAEFSFKATIAGIRGPRVDIVYASSPHLLAPVAGWIVAKVKRAQLIVEIRDLWPESFVALGAIRRDGIAFRALQLLEKWIYRRADWIVGVTDQWRPYFEEMAPGRGFSSIPNGTDMAAFDSALPGDAINRQLGRSTSGLRFVFAGSHGPKDGIDLLLNVVKEFPDDLFVLIGDGTDKVKIEARVQEEQLKNVVLLPPVTKSELPSYLKAMDVGLHLVSDWDIFKKGMSPNKLHDYLGSALPVISNAEGEPHLILHESGAGLGVAPLDIASGLRKMKELTPAERHAMGRRGREWMLANRSRSIVAKTLEDLLNSVTTRVPHG